MLKKTDPPVPSPLFFGGPYGNLQYVQRKDYLGFKERSMIMVLRSGPTPKVSPDM